MKDLAELLGKAVRDEWVHCKQEEVAQGKEVPEHHLTDWEHLDERNKEIDRRIGLAVAKKMDQIVGALKVANDLGLDLNGK